MSIGRVWWRRILKALGTLAVLAAVLGAVAWYKVFRVVPQPAFANEEMRFKYGSLGSEADRGIPYWIWLVLPRVFPDLLPGPGGYRSLGLPWEPGQELPVGFALKTVGFPRVTNNCAVCHTATYRTREDELPRIVTGGPAHTSDVQANIRFLTRCASDPRWNADILLDAISQVYGLSWLDKLLYRYALIPFTKRALLQQAKQFEWMDRPGKPHWGPGRDDPMNLTKYFMTSMPEDQSVGQADFPSIWNLKVRKGDSLLLNWSGDTPAVRSVLIDSALGLGAPPGEPFLKRMAELDDFLSALPPPPFPPEFPVDSRLAAAGAPVYEQHCADCHEPGRSTTNKVVPIEEIGTDRERMDTWTQAAADQANRKVKEMGIIRPDMVKNFGYVSPPLDGVWLRAPYLHNGSVPTLRALLDPAEKRPRTFVRGYDVYDPVAVGFRSDPAELGFEGDPPALRPGARRRTGLFLHDTTRRGDGNGGHLYGTTLSEAEKASLLEYLKTK
jgi:mono/diheme cytochrome c family protein